jgi:membrane protease YdiL (CAAX protease family)
MNLPVHLRSLASGISPLIGGLILVKGLKRPNNLTLFSIGFWETIGVVVLPIILFFVVGSFNIGEPNYAIVLAILVAIVYAVFEEYGWRGYLQSELTEISAIYKYLIVSVLWFAWHLDFGLDRSHLLSYLFVLIGSMGIGYVADKSKSLLLPSLFHMFFNVLFSNTLVGVTFLQKAIILLISAISVISVMRWSLRKIRMARSMKEK